VLAGRRTRRIDFALLAQDQEGALAVTASVHVAFGGAIGQRCVSYVETCHSPEKVLALYEQVFEQLMKPHSCATGPPLNRNQQPVARDRRK
jgi:hypothetical protein